MVTNIRNFLLVLVLVQEYQKSLQNIPSSSPGSSARWQGLNNPAAPPGPRRLSPEPPEPLSAAAVLGLIYAFDRNACIRNWQQPPENSDSRL